MGFKNIIGYEPSIKLCKQSRTRGIKTINSFFDERSALKLKGRVDLVLASNVFAHNDNLDSMFLAMKNSIKKKGLIIVEVQYFVKTIKDYSFDNIYHEHANYWTFNSLNIFIKKFNCKIYDVEKIETHGGSLRLYISKDLAIKSKPSISKILKEEDNFKIKDKKTYLMFEKNLQKKKINVMKNIYWLKKK